MSIWCLYEKERCCVMLCGEKRKQSREELVACWYCWGVCSVHVYMGSNWDKSTASAHLFPLPTHTCGFGWIQPVEEVFWCFMQIVSSTHSTCIYAHIEQNNVALLLIPYVPSYYLHRKVRQWLILCHLTQKKFIPQYNKDHHTSNVTLITAGRKTCSSIQWELVAKLVKFPHGENFSVWV